MGKLFAIMITDTKIYCERCEDYKAANARANELVDEANQEEGRHFEVDIIEEQREVKNE